MFDLDRYIEDCRAAVREDSSHKAAREVLARANSDPAAILAAIGEPARGGVTKTRPSDLHEEVRFASDSSLEADGFEPSVSHTKQPFTLKRSTC